MMVIALMVVVMMMMMMIMMLMTMMLRMMIIIVTMMVMMTMMTLTIMMLMMTLMMMTIMMKMVVMMVLSHYTLLYGDRGRDGGGSSTMLVYAVPPYSVFATVAVSCDVKLQCIYHVTVIFCCYVANLKNGNSIPRVQWRSLLKSRVRFVGLYRKPSEQSYPSATQVATTNLESFFATAKYRATEVSTPFLMQHPPPPPHPQTPDYFAEACDDDKACAGFRAQDGRVLALAREGSVLLPVPGANSA